jgi:hypothetical protein
MKTLAGFRYRRLVLLLAERLQAGLAGFNTGGALSYWTRWTCGIDWRNNRIGGNAMSGISGLTGLVGGYTLVLWYGWTQGYG